MFWGNVRVPRYVVKGLVSLIKANATRVYDLYLLRGHLIDVVNVRDAYLKVMSFGGYDIIGAYSAYQSFYNRVERVVNIINSEA